MATYIVLLGPPGSGKGTQAKLVAAKFGLPQVSTGDLFRAMKAQDTPLARKVQETMALGHLISDEITIDVVKERLSRDDCRSGATLDGFPRTLVQADALENLLEDAFKSRVSIVPLFEVDRDETVRRISGRAEQEGRQDDSLEVAQERYRIYVEETAKLIDYYAEKGVLVRIDGSRPIADVTADLMAAIEKRIQAAR